MVGQPVSGRLTDMDFSDLLQALSATTKGRLFLAEYLRRFRPQETRMLLEALQRIETTMASVRDQLQPERISAELRRLSTTLEIAISDSEFDTPGQAQRNALLNRIRFDLDILAESLAAPDLPSEAARIRAYEPVAEPLGEETPAIPLQDDLGFLESAERTRSSER